MKAPAVTIAKAMADKNLLGKPFTGPSWNAWRAVLKAAFALPMSDKEIATFRELAERDPPARQVRELIVVSGRRCGKDSIASAIAAHAAAFHDYRRLLRPGERAICSCIACDRTQAGIVHAYIKAYFANGLLKGLVEREVADGLELTTGASVEIITNSHRTSRGRTYAIVIFDEVGFWLDENSARPDREVYRAVRPGLATVPGSMLVLISSPHRKSGLLYDRFKRHFGKDGDVLVIRAPSTALNPTLDRAIIEEALAEDPEAARSEWLGEFRDDLTSYVDPTVVERLVVPGRYELPRVPGEVYTGFADAAGGSGGDSFAGAVAHRDRATKRCVVDAVREVRPPFSPEAACEMLASFFKSYGIRRITLDRWGGEFPPEAFRKHGVDCAVSERAKSDIYRDALPLMNSGMVELPDHRRLVSQICGLERRVARGGKDSVDHGPSGHDDLANCVCGVITLCVGSAGFDPATVNWQRVNAAWSRPMLRSYGH